MSSCNWCTHPGHEDEDAENLCRTHLAEREGMSEAELDRMDDEQAAEYADAFG